jgi:hypothetical protein
MPPTYNYGLQPFADLLMAQRVSYSGSNAEYIGYAPPGSAGSDPVWQICKLTYDSSDNFIKRSWAGGTNSQDKVWNNRESYDYL